MSTRLLQEQYNVWSSYTNRSISLAGIVYVSMYLLYPIHLLTLHTYTTSYTYSPYILTLYMHLLYQRTYSTTCAYSTNALILYMHLYFPYTYATPCTYATLSYLLTLPIYIHDPCTYSNNAYLLVIFYMFIKFSELFEVKYDDSNNTETCKYWRVDSSIYLVL